MKNYSIQAPTFPEFSRIEKSLSIFKELLRQENLSANFSWSAESFEKFIELDSEYKDRTARYFESYVNLLYEAKASGIPLRNNRLLVWKSLQILGLRPCEKTLETIEDDDIVEIYTNQHIQIFRNLKFIELCSYSIPDLLVYDWPTLYKREEWVGEKLMGQIQTVLDHGQAPEKVQIDSYVLEEIFSDECRKFKIKEGHYSPLWSRETSIGKKKPYAILATKKAWQF